MVTEEPSGWLAGKPEYLQKPRFPEGYEKTSEEKNISAASDLSDNGDIRESALI